MQQSLYTVISFPPRTQIISGVKGSVGEVGTVVRRWKEVLGSLDAANMLLGIHTNLEDAEKAESNHRFLEAAEHYAKVTDALLRKSAGLVKCCKYLMHGIMDDNDD